MKSRRTYTKTEGPFHVIRKHGPAGEVKFVVAINNTEFLSTPETDVIAPEGRPRLMRAQAYAIARLLNSQKEFRAWGSKFSDPYVAKLS